MKTSIILYSFLASLLPLASAHARIREPKPLGFESTPELTGNGYNKPLAPDGSDFPCKGLINKVDMTPQAKWRAGSKAFFEIQPNDAPGGGEGELAAHSGGSCQVSLSYDEGDTFKVLHSFVGGCPRDTPLNSNIAGPNQTFTFDVPAEAKAGNAIMAWSWIARTGNRMEYYMNCASVEIEGTGTSTLDDLPDMWVGEMTVGDIKPGMCGSVAGTNFDFPAPGDFKTISTGDGAAPVGPTGPGPEGDFSVCKSPKSKYSVPAPEEPEVPPTEDDEVPEQAPTPKPTPVDLSFGGVTYSCYAKSEL